MQTRSPHSTLQSALRHTLFSLQKTNEGTAKTLKLPKTNYPLWEAKHCFSDRAAEGHL